jgi:CDP-paratose 2-epimerase
MHELKLEGKMDIAQITESTGLIGVESVRFFSYKGFIVVGIDNNMKKKKLGCKTSTQWNRKKLGSDSRRWNDAI